MSSTSRRLGARDRKRDIRITPDRRASIDQRKLARALIHLAQADYDARHPEQHSAEADPRSPDTSPAFDRNEWE